MKKHIFCSLVVGLWSMNVFCAHEPLKQLTVPYSTENNKNAGTLILPLNADFPALYNAVQEQAGYSSGMFFFESRKAYGPFFQRCQPICNERSWQVFQKQRNSWNASKLHIGLLYSARHRKRY